MVGKISHKMDLYRGMSVRERVLSSIEQVSRYISLAFTSWYPVLILSFISQTALRRKKNSNIK